MHFERIGARLIGMMEFHLETVSGPLLALLRQLMEVEILKPFYQKKYPSGSLWSVEKSLA